jgi:hypothetical protein
MGQLAPLRRGALAVHGRARLDTLAEVRPLVGGLYTL